MLRATMRFKKPSFDKDGWKPRFTSIRAVSIPSKQSGALRPSSSWLTGFVLVEQWELPKESSKIAPDYGKAAPLIALQWESLH